MDDEIRIELLREEHAKLDREIRRAEATPSIGDLEVTAMKRRKLKLSDTIVRISGHG